MKKLLFSFLFSYCVFLNIDLLSAQQQQKDSIQHYFNLAINARNKTDSEQSFKFFNNLINIQVKKKNTLGEVSTLTLIAQIQRNLGLLNESEETAVKAIKLLNQNKNALNKKRYEVSLYNHLGILYKENGNFQTSINYFEKVLKLIKEPKSKITALNNLGNVYREKKDFETAIKLYTDAYHKCYKVNDKKQKARILNNLGKAQSMINDTTAINNLEKAFVLRKEVNYQNGVISSLLSLGEYYKKKRDTLQALNFAKEALISSRSSLKTEQKLAAIELQCDLAYFNNYPEYKTLKDSLQKARLLSRNLYAAIKYDKEKEVKKADEYERRFERILLFSTFLGLLFVFISKYQKTKHKKEKVQQVYLTETRISKKVHDEVANDIYQVMTKLQEDSTIKDHILDDLDNIYNRTRDISRENSDLALHDNFEITLNDLFLSYKNDDINIITRNIAKIDWKAIDAYKKITLYRVLQELMVNMKKHSQASNAALTFNESNNKIVINYTDNGKGCKIEKGTGLLNMENRIKSIKGTIIFESEIHKGFKAKITV